MSKNKEKNIDIVIYLNKQNNKIFDKDMEASHLLAGEDVIKGKKIKQQVNLMIKDAYHYVQNTIFDLQHIIMDKYNYDEEEALKYLNNKLNKNLSKEEI